MPLTQQLGSARPLSLKKKCQRIQRRRSTEALEMLLKSVLLPGQSGSTGSVQGKGAQVESEAGRSPISWPLYVVFEGNCCEAREKTDCSGSQLNQVATSCWYPENPLMTNESRASARPSLRRHRKRRRTRCRVECGDALETPDSDGANCLVERQAKPQKADLPQEVGTWKADVKSTLGQSPARLLRWKRSRFRLPRSSDPELWGRQILPCSQRIWCQMSRFSLSLIKNIQKLLAIFQAKPQKADKAEKEKVPSAVWGTLWLWLF